MKQLLADHFEWVAFTAGLILLALMNPYADSGFSLCLLEFLNVPYCPGEGLGHSIAMVFRGDFDNALEANILGPFAVAVLAGRIIYLLKDRVFNHKQNGDYYD